MTFYIGLALILVLIFIFYHSSMSNTKTILHQLQTIKDFNNTKLIWNLFIENGLINYKLKNYDFFGIVQFRISWKNLQSHQFKHKDLERTYSLDRPPSIYSHYKLITGSSRMESYAAISRKTLLTFYLKDGTNKLPYRFQYLLRLPIYEDANEYLSVYSFHNKDGDSLNLIIGRLEEESTMTSLAAISYRLIQED